MNRILYISALILPLFLFSPADIHAQEKIGEYIEIDKTVHNFGDILLDSGPVSCTFTVKNIGTKPLVIYIALKGYFYGKRIIVIKSTSCCYFT